MAGIKVIVPPAIEPVTLKDVLTQLKYDDPDPETKNNLLGLISAAREWCEGHQNRVYIERTLELALDEWPCGKEIKLPRPPLRRVISLTYTNSGGADVTWPSANYTTDDYSFVAKLVKNKSVNWPSGCLAVVNGIKVRYVAGYESVPGEVVTGEALGTGDVAEKTYTVQRRPVEQDSESVYFDGTPTSAYTIDYEIGEVICTPGDGVVVTIDYTEATDYAANVPQRVKQAILLLVTHWFDNGMCEPPQAVKSLLGQDRVIPI